MKHAQTWIEGAGPDVVVIAFCHVEPVAVTAGMGQQHERRIFGQVCASANRTEHAANALSGQSS